QLHFARAGRDARARGAVSAARSRRRPPGGRNQRVERASAGAGRVAPAAGAGHRHARSIQCARADWGKGAANMIRVALWVRLQAKSGRETEVAKFLESALPLANQEATTPVWFALRLGPQTFGIFDAFADDAG